MFIAEREGFEPPEPLSSTVFKTAAIDHSAISPIPSGCASLCDRGGMFLVLFLQTCCPGRTRTLTGGTRIRSATITPPDKFSVTECKFTAFSFTCIALHYKNYTINIYSQFNLSHHHGDTPVLQGSQWLCQRFLSGQRRSYAVVG